jgi:uncharacterized protein (DUF58 family)
MTPSSRLLWILLAASSASLAVPLLGVPFGLALLPSALVLAVALADRLGGTATALTVVRKVRPVLSVGTDNPVELEVRNRSRRRYRLELLDETPTAGRSDPEEPLRTLVRPWKTERLGYGFTPSRRGRHAFEGVRLSHPSRMGLWRVRRRLELHDEVQVFPNIVALHRFELLARRNNLVELGLRPTRMKGDGTEFERLREYRTGDDPRSVDWKTTARLGRLIVREMGQERNQNVLFLIDAGRMMRQTAEGLSHFDYALNTAIILGHIATRRGDNIGALLFSDRVERFVPLGRGRIAVDSLVRAGYDVEPAEVATNYRRAFKHVLARVRRRSLVLLMTHLVPGEDQRLIRAYASMLGRRHLPLCLFFREPSVEREARKVPRNVAEAFHRSAAGEILLDRAEGLSFLRHAGVLALDAPPSEYSATAVSQYLDIKARNLL